MVFGFLFAFVFGAIGIGFLNSANKKTKAVRDDFSRVIRATVISNRLKHDSDGRSYFPIYEYWLAGERKTFESHYGSSRQVPIGTELDLIQERETGKIYERRSIKFDWILGTVFTGVGLLCTIVLISKIVLF